MHAEGRAYMISEQQAPHHHPPLRFFVRLCLEVRARCGAGGAPLRRNGCRSVSGAWRQLRLCLHGTGIAGRLARTNDPTLLLALHALPLHGLPAHACAHAPRAPCAPTLHTCMRVQWWAGLLHGPNPQWVGVEQGAHLLSKQRVRARGPGPLKGRRLHGRRQSRTPHVQPASGRGMHGHCAPQTATLLCFPHSHTALAPTR
jgi:hypothetical protein